MSKRLHLVFVALILGGCASGRYIVDTKGVDPETYEQDLAECKAYGDQVGMEDDIAKSAGAGAVIGSLLGLVVGNKESAVRMGSVMAIQGGSVAGLKSDQERDQVVKRCLRQRGYKVLN